MDYPRNFYHRSSCCKCKRNHHHGHNHGHHLNSNCDNRAFPNQTIYAQLVNPCKSFLFNVNRPHNYEKERINVFYQYEHPANLPSYY